MSSSDKLECQAAQKFQAQNWQKQFTSNKLCYEALEYTWGSGNATIKQTEPHKGLCLVCTSLRLIKRSWVDSLSVEITISISNDFVSYGTTVWYKRTIKIYISIRLKNVPCSLAVDSIHHPRAPGTRTLLSVSFNLSFWDMESSSQ